MLYNNESNSSDASGCSFSFDPTWSPLLCSSSVRLLSQDVNFGELLWCIGFLRVVDEQGRVNRGKKGRKGAAPAVTYLREGVQLGDFVLEDFVDCVRGGSSVSQPRTTRRGTVEKGGRKKAHLPGAS